MKTVSLVLTGCVGMCRGKKCYRIDASCPHSAKLVVSMGSQTKIALPRKNAKILFQENLRCKVVIMKTEEKHRKYFKSSRCKKNSATLCFTMYLYKQHCSRIFKR